MTWRPSTALAIAIAGVVASCRGDSISAVLLVGGAALLVTAEVLLRLQGQRLTRTHHRRWEVTCRHCNYGQIAYLSAKRLHLTLRAMWRHNRMWHSGGAR